jgi:uncharacterized SAM-binding protein YcdF (DUF218 family)
LSGPAAQSSVEPVRVIAVLGFSSGRGGVLHPICADRLRHAESLASGARAVVLSGWSRHPDGRGEAELMRDAWRGPAVELICDPTARNTAGNAASVARTANHLGAGEIVVVTSRWHSLRARVLVRAAVRSRPIAVSTSSPAGRPPPRLLAREAACLAALPVQLAVLRRQRRRAGEPAGPLVEPGVRERAAR